ncbi:MAG: CRISPR-associated endonuclease Cas3'' [Archaeoglobaceae archaeon]
MIVARLKPEQTLEEHLKLCIEALKSLSSIKILDIFKGTENLLKIAIVFHDSGKIFYQQRIKKGKGFLGHELFSTFIVDEFLQCEDLRVSFDSRFLIDAIVLYHHYAMGLSKREEKFFREFKSGFRISEDFEKILREHEEIVLELLNLDESATKKAMKKVNIAVKGHLEKGLLQYGWIFKNLRYINKEIWDRFVADRVFRKLMLVGINVMTIVDYLGAKTEDGRGSEFSRVIDEFISLYYRGGLNKGSESF